MNKKFCCLLILIIFSIPIHGYKVDQNVETHQYISEESFRIWNNSEFEKYKF